MHKRTTTSGRLPATGPLKPQSLLSRILCMTPVQYIPVRIQKGPAKGARWTLLPYAFLWRSGGERDIVTAFGMLGELRGACCWDFGAHFGIQTLAMAMRVGKDGEVAAFEPNPASFARLKLHVGMNRLSNIKMFDFAVGSRLCDAALALPGAKCSLGAHLHLEEGGSEENVSSVRVSIVPLDLLVGRGELRLPDFIKVDVQGHGGQALMGSIAAIEKKRPLILFSNHCEQEFEEARELLSPLGYEVFDPGGNLAGWDYFRAPWWQTGILKSQR
jgi:FkbM family methyltransferase